MAPTSPPRAPKRLPARPAARILLAAALAAVLLAPAPAEAQKVGVTSHQFLKVMPSARGTALGEAFTSLADRADAVFWNPAGMTRGASHEVATTHTMWLVDTRQTALAYAFRHRRLGSFGLQVQHVDYGEINETRVDHLGFVGEEYNPGLTGNTFRPYALSVGLSYARAFTDQFSAGVTAKFVTESLWSGRSVELEGDGGGTFNTYANSALFDLGMQYDTGFRSVRIGAAVQNFGPQVTFASESFPAPLTFRLGVAADLLGPDALLPVSSPNRLSVAYDIVHPNDYAQQMHLGAEYVYADLLSLRAGYKMNYDVDSWTFGGGVHTAVDRYRLRFDYSFGAMSELLNHVHRLSLSLSID